MGILVLSHDVMSQHGSQSLVRVIPIVNHTKNTENNEWLKRTNTKPSTFSLAFSYSFFSGRERGRASMGGTDYWPGPICFHRGWHTFSAKDQRVMFYSQAIWSLSRLSSVSFYMK